MFLGMTNFRHWKGQPVQTISEQSISWWQYYHTIYHVIQADIRRQHLYQKSVSYKRDSQNVWYFMSFKQRTPLSPALECILMINFLHCYRVLCPISCNYYPGVTLYWIINVTYCFTSRLVSKSNHMSSSCCLVDFDDKNNKNITFV